MIVSDVKIHYGISDTSIGDDSRTETVSSQSEYVQEDLNLLSVENRERLGWLEKDFFVLDGSHLFPEKTKKYNVGWESSSLSDEDGNINEYVQFNFEQVHASFGIMLYFFNDSIIKDFQIDYFKDDTLVKTHSVTNNELTKLTIFDIIEEWNTVKISITKTQPLQRARIYAVSFGIGSDLDKNSIIKASASVVTDISVDAFETGSFSFQFFNAGDVFSIQDIREMPLALQENIMATIFVEFNNSGQFVTFGRYNSTDIKIEEQGTIITISGYDELYNLNNTVFKKGIVYPGGRSLGDWAREVAEDCNVEIDIDDSFDSIFSKGYITEVPHREAFRLIAEAGNGYLWIDSDSVIHISKYVTPEQTEISDNEIVEDTLVVDSSERIFGVQVSRYAFSPTKELVAGGLGYLEEVALTSEPQELEIVYNQYPAVVNSIEIYVDTTSSAVLSDIKIYSDRCVFKLSGMDGDTTWVTVTGKAYNQAIIYDSAGSLLKTYKKIENNYLITDDIGLAVAEYQNSIVSNRYIYSVELVSENKVFELGDKTILNDNSVIVESINFSVEHGKQNLTIGGTNSDN